MSSKYISHFWLVSRILHKKKFKRHTTHTGHNPGENNSHTSLKTEQFLLFSPFYQLIKNLHETQRHLLSLIVTGLLALGCRILLALLINLVTW